MRILHIEDDDTLRVWIKTGLTQAGFAVDGARDAKEGLQLASENIYDIILLDIGLPELSGYWAVRALRQTGQTAPIFMISGQAGEEDKSIAYEAGADDYMTKPIFLSELVAKIHRWLQRRNQFLSSDAPSTVLTVGKLNLELLKHRASMEGRLIALTPKEIGVLEYLMRQAGKVVTQTQIAQAVWNVDFDRESNIVEATIKRLRKKLDANSEESIIVTMRGAGYMIEDSV